MGGSLRIFDASGDGVSLTAFWALAAAFTVTLAAFVLLAVCCRRGSGRRWRGEWAQRLARAEAQVAENRQRLDGAECACERVAAVQDATLGAIRDAFGRKGVQVPDGLPQPERHLHAVEGA